MTPFDLLHTPLKGINLIEAAAGTGKTYTIEGLFIRLVIEKQLPVAQILVVTFTRAATAELQDRIYRRLAKARDVMAGAPVRDDDLLRDLAARTADPRQAHLLLRQALIDFDRAAIFTIHGFCQRVLYENAFETASAFDVELIEDQTAILVEVVEDFWRQEISGQPPEFLQFAKNSLGNPQRLLALARKASAAEFAITPCQKTPCLRRETLDSFRHRLEQLRACWPHDRDDVGLILRNAALNGRSYGTLQPEESGRPSGRERTVRSLIDAMDLYLAQPSPSCPPIAAVSKLAAAALSRATLKNRPPPFHPVFEACEGLHRTAQALVAEMNGQLHYLKGRLLNTAAAELERRKCERGLVSFDDLLWRVARTLAADRGHELVRSVRARYQAALVDEFQDTDDLQYAVFARLFSAPSHLLCMIGDPKQAIYSFRGADIFSYLRAARKAEARFTLIRNWRSSPGLVRAVNTLFSRSAEPFLFPDIGFFPGTPARDEPAATAAAMVIWHLDARRHRDDGKVLSKTEAQPLMARAVTAEIQLLIADHGVADATGEIAVLVRTNRQAALMKTHLSAAGVPSVVYSTANVFDATEAFELLTLLSSIAEPHSIAKLKAAAATHLLGVSAEAIVAEERCGELWERRIRRHWEYLRLWSERGFMAMLRQWISGEGVKQRLLMLPDGERRLTNLLHLAELANQAASDNGYGVAGLLKWLRRQIDPHGQRAEATQLRLESDEHAVKIVTVHRSKGLEYPVVFCPFAWSGSSLSGSEVFFHDPDNDYRLTIDLSSDRDSPSRVRAQNEILAENLRMLYVAVTRAQRRCYLAWGRINTAETSALAYLLRCGGRAAGKGAENDWISRLRAEFSAIDDDEMRRRLDELAAVSEGTILVRPLPESPVRQIAKDQPTSHTLACREFRGRIDSTWALTSYSALASAADVDTADHDASFPVEMDEGRAEDHRSTSDGGIFDFPPGARAGTFFHALFEALDFTGTEFRTVVEGKLQEFGFDPMWVGPVCRMIGEVLSVPIFSGNAAVRLAEIGKNRRVSEMEFYYPLNLITPALLEEVLANGRIAPDLAGSQINLSSERLHFAPTRGFMKGFIDLVFEHGGRYYLIDWKSNRLGAALEHYHHSRLGPVMRAHRYDLQYHLYTLALHQYLRRRVRGYEYARDFGGVCYVFLRGVNGSHGPDYGLFCDRPEPRLVHALGKALIPGYA
jgi:exodeoxyribonuclease V beta subunit